MTIIRRPQLLAAPLFIIGLLLLLLNDHIFKDAFGNMLTGKLSDFAGLFIFPLFWLVFFKSRRWVYCLTAIAFILWKSPFSQSFIDSWNVIGLFSIGRVVDLTDLLALAILPFSYWYSLQTFPKVKHIPAIAGLVAFFAFCATSDNYGYHIEFDNPVKVLIQLKEPAIGLDTDRLIESMEYYHKERQEYKVYNEDVENNHYLLDSNLLLLTYSYIRINHFPDLDDGFYRAILRKRFLHSLLEESAFYGSNDTLFAPVEDLFIEKYGVIYHFKNSRLDGEQVYKYPESCGTDSLFEYYSAGLEHGTWQSFECKTDPIKEETYIYGELHETVNYNSVDGSRSIVKARTRHRVIQTHYWYIALFIVLCLLSIWGLKYVNTKWFYRIMWRRSDVWWLTTLKMLSMLVYGVVSAAVGFVIALAIFDSFSKSTGVDIHDFFGVEIIPFFIGVFMGAINYGYFVLRQRMLEPLTYCMFTALLIFTYVEIMTLLAVIENTKTLLAQ